MTGFHCRSAFISDVHLGTPDCKAAYLLHFLRRLRCEKLYLVGDIIDVEALSRRRWWHPSHSAVIAQVLALARRGVEVVYIPGNHDAPLRGLHGQCVGGVRIALDAVHVAADGRRYRVSHGDEFDPARIGRRWMLLGEAMHRLVCWSNRRLHAWRQRLALPYLPLSIILKSRIGKALAYIRAYEQRVADDARERGFDGHICGHIHFGHVRELGGVLYLNDGDWVEHCTVLVEDGAGAMELLHWSEHATALGRASRERVWPSPAAVLPLAPLGAAHRRGEADALHRTA
ncbi:UDP-2,3-diacylglucosamine diphosphatase [Rhodanobacter sp. KK11]|uniref:UDP-2,3-diacylglucosamine diphosphatase n=1 Tax=Rhodanobacter sp. KK11 TaxID=3083255 RepID=UPI0029664A23|nr:UDP-2,3-diacylglucosamine diphosphatase [Rhodanobacter sp. KK11]MDW2980185.1 UDP-2,3-diacylglucosamine diphosphatase [Rhodanobacter sp. KK11]